VGTEDRVVEVAVDKVDGVAEDKAETEDRVVGVAEDKVEVENKEYWGTRWERRIGWLEWQ
jgi:hypothetical protein